MTTTLRPSAPSEGPFPSGPPVAAGTSPARRTGDPGAQDTGLTGSLLGGALVAGSVAACFTGGASAVLYAYPALAVAVALGLLLRRRWYSYLAFLLVVWLASAGVRRVVDWQTVFHTVSPITITGSLVSLVALPWALAARRPAYRDARLALMVASAVVCYGLATGVVTNGASPALADFLLLAGPLATGLFVLSVPEDDARLRRVVQGLALWGCLLVGGYALVQFLFLPPWDAQWIVDSGITSVGRPEAGQFRAFGTLSTTGPLGYTMAVLLLLLVAERRARWQVPVALVGLAALAVTLIRGGWLGLVLGVALLLVRGRTQAWRIVVLVVLLLVTVFSLGGPIRDQVEARASDTASEGTEDTSLVVRLSFQAQIAPQALTDPTGTGMGATGVATDLSSADLAYDRYRNFDSGLFETLTRYGVLAGGALLGCVVWTVVQATRRARRGTLFQSACTAAMVALTVGIVLTDTLRSVYGVLFWTLIAVQGRPTAAVLARRARRLAA